MLNNRWVKLLIWLILYIAFLEVILNVGGVVFIVGQDWQNKARIKEKNVYKIMCLGDSMTALGAENSFPSQLEKALNEGQRSGQNKSKLQFKVINKGIPCANSTKIVESLGGFLKEYSPDMVVVMMGVMDQNSPLSEEKNGYLSRLDRALNRLKTYRLFRKIAAQCVMQAASDMGRLPIFPKKTVDGPAQLVNERPVPQENVVMLMYAIHFRNTNEYLKAEAILRYLLSLDLDKGFLERVKSELINVYHEQKRYKDMIPLLDHFLGSNELDKVASSWVDEICSQKADEEDMIPMLTSLVVKKPQSIALNGRLGECYAFYGHPQLAQVYLNRAKALSEHWDNIVLQHNYLSLYEILKQQGIKGVFVQYPNVDVRLLKKIFIFTEVGNNIIFVSNEDNFKSSLDPGRYSDYFTDHILYDFGHCTPKGNHLLASQVAQKIVQYLNSL